MNKRTVSISRFVMLVFAVTVLPFSMWAVTPNIKKSALTDDEMRWRIDNLVGPVDYRYTSKVRSEVEAYIFDYPKGAEELLGRVTIYFPLFEKKLKEKNLPEELKYLSIIESALRVNAYSRVGAAGLWQFMQPTAREYGLTVNKSVDQRYSVEKSTEAALEYLSVLHDQFGDWTLALAAYNCGPGNVRKAIRRSGKSDYWGIRAFLPKETRNYIPKFVAASYLLEYYNEYNLMPVRQEQYYFESTESLVFQHLSFEKISMITDTPLDIIQQLNPSYRKNFIPANTNGMILNLPRQAMFRLMDMEGSERIQLLAENQINFNHYIRSNFKPEIASYLLVNHFEKFDIAPLPLKSIAYFKHDSQMIKSRPIEENSLRMAGIRRELRNKEFIEHRLKSGETLRDVSKKYPNTDFETLIRINRISMDHSPAPGTLLKILKK